MAKVSIPILVDWEEIKNYLAQNDIVEVVRCKDCKYSERDDVGRYYCRDLDCQMGDIDGNGFCSDAERRTENADVNT